MIEKCHYGRRIRSNSLRVPWIIIRIIEIGDTRGDRIGICCLINLMLLSYKANWQKDGYLQLAQ